MSTDLIGRPYEFVRREARWARSRAEVALASAQGMLRAGQLLKGSSIDDTLEAVTSAGDLATCVAILAHDFDTDAVPALSTGSAVAIARDADVDIGLLHAGTAPLDAVAAALRVLGIVAGGSAIEDVDTRAIVGGVAVGAVGDVGDSGPIAGLQLAMVRAFRDTTAIGEDVTGLHKFWAPYWSRSGQDTFREGGYFCVGGIPKWTGGHDTNRGRIVPDTDPFAISPDGVLYLRQRKATLDERALMPFDYGPARSFFGAAVNTRHSFAFTRGALSVIVRHRSNAGALARGLWDAIWLVGMSSQWPDAGEVDIYETASSTNAAAITGASNWYDAGGQPTKSGANAIPDLRDEVVEYVCAWTAGAMATSYRVLNQTTGVWGTWVPIASIVLGTGGGEGVFPVPMFLTINATTGDNGGATQANAEADFPAAGPAWPLGIEVFAVRYFAPPDAAHVRAIGTVRNEVIDVGEQLVKPIPAPTQLWGEAVAADEVLSNARGFLDVGAAAYTDLHGGALWDDTARTLTWTPTQPGRRQFLVHGTNNAGLSGIIPFHVDVRPRWTLGDITWVAEAPIVPVDVYAAFEVGNCARGKRVWLDAGVLPAGIVLGDDGVLRGTPVDPADPVQVRFAGIDARGMTATATITIEVGEPAAGWTPAEWATAVWIDPNDPDAITLDDDAVDALDAVQGTATLAQLTADHRPTLVADAIVGRNVLEFDGVDDALESADGDLTGINGGSEVKSTVVMVLRRTGGSSTALCNARVGAGPTSSVRWGMSASAIYTQANRAGTDKLATRPQTVTDWTILSWITAATGAVTIRRDGVPILTDGDVTATGFVAAFGKFVVGASYNGDQAKMEFHIAGRISEIIVDATVRSAAEVRAAEEFLAARHGIVLGAAS